MHCFPCLTRELVSGFHFAELSIRLPRSNPFYEYTYVTKGEIWAFAVGCFVLLDYCLMITYVARTWSRYVDFLFLNKLNATNPVLSVDSHVYHDSFDWLAMVGILASSMIAPRSIKACGSSLLVT
ncbi:unnamed protein product [Soboliphyme baturini]|uniref:Ion_trans domain-containing protein n=1 Tax=Soboliphyme baturini TaxID=241478 RepID=A0A183IMW6_9BILA|nr:unnamed protein product [Soboliphyme baturini]